MSLTRDSLAKISGIGLRSLAAIESGEATNPHIETVMRIADALDTTIDSLLGVRG
jgi:transcriptional regulator with XRE-family HTH domain